MQTKTTKKSMWACGLSVLLCLALLIGTTLAWFTDSVTNRNNRIQAGTLNVTFERMNIETGDFTEVGENPIFDCKTWEPGYSVHEVFKIGNEGSLALKYQLDLVVNGEVSALADVIDVYYKATTDKNEIQSDLATSMDDITDKGYKYAGTLADVLASTNGAANGHIEAAVGNEEQADYAAIVLHMQEDAGNTYQGLSIGGTFDIVLKATQYTSETDGFGSNQYDAGATYPVSTADEFKQALANAKEGDTISLAGDLEITEPVTMKSGVTIDGNGADFVTSVANNVAIDIPAGVTGVTIKNCDIFGSDNASTASERPMGIAIRPGAGDVTIDNCTFTGSAAKLGHSIWIDGGNTGNIVIRNCKIPRPINLSGYNNTVSNVTIENNTFSNTFGVDAVTLCGALHNVTIANNTIGFGGFARVHKDGLNYFDFQNVVIEGNSKQSITVDPEVQAKYDEAVQNGGIVIR